MGFAAATAKSSRQEARLRALETSPSLKIKTGLILDPYKPSFILFLRI